MRFYSTDFIQYNFDITYLSSRVFSFLLFTIIGGDASTQTSHRHLSLWKGHTQKYTHLLWWYKDWHISPGCGPLDSLQICERTFRAEKSSLGSADIRAPKERTDMAWKMFTKTRDRLRYTLFNLSRHCRVLNTQCYRGRGRGCLDPTERHP